MEKHLEAFEELIVQLISWQSHKKKGWNFALCLGIEEVWWIVCWDVAISCDYGGVIWLARLPTGILRTLFVTVSVKTPFCKEQKVQLSHLLYRVLGSEDTYSPKTDELCFLAKVTQEYVCLTMLLVFLLLHLFVISDFNYHFTSGNIETLDWGCANSHPVGQLYFVLTCRQLDTPH